MASFVVTCTSGLCPSPFAGTYTEEATGLFVKGYYKITKDDGRESYTAKGPVGLYFTLSPAGALNEFTGTETYNTIRNKTNDGTGKRQIKAFYIPADVPPEPPAAVPSPAGLGVDGVPQPDPSTTKPDPAHAKVAETKGSVGPSAHGSSDSCFVFVVGSAASSFFVGPAFVVGSSRAFVVGARYAHFVHCSHRVSLHHGTNNSATTGQFLF